jgi:hypothetical protein
MKPTVLRPNSRTQLSDTLSLCSFLNGRGQVSHPLRATGKIIVFLYILMLTFLDGGREYQILWTMPVQDQYNYVFLFMTINITFIGMQKIKNSLHLR